MQCLQRYDWVKLLRSHLPEGKGVMGTWAKLASRAAFRKGISTYCGYSNPVKPGMWAGGVVGLKSILGAKKRYQALQTMDLLQELGYISYVLDPATKKLTYHTDIQLQTLRRSIEAFNMKIILRRDSDIFYIENI